MCTTANNREIIEPRIIQLVRELTAAPATDEVADALKPVMEQVVDQAASSSQGGKRLRALLALDAFDILAGDVTPDRRDAMIDLACAIEVFHTAALVHDDIIDESDLRRGRPSAHRALEQAVHSEYRKAGATSPLAQRSSNGGRMARSRGGVAALVDVMS